MSAAFGFRFPLGGNHLRRKFSVTLRKIVPIEEVNPVKTFLISLFVVLLCGAIIFIGTTELHPQTRRGMKISVHTSAGEHIELYNASYALVIGNGNYTNGWDPLPGALQDVKEVAETLKTHDFNVTLKTDLTSDEFNEAFLTFVLEDGADENNRLLFYYAGHGYTLPLANEQERGYLVMVDALDPDTDKLGFVRGSINMETLVGESKAIRARHVLFLFDSCFSGTILNARDRVIPESISDNIRHPVRQFITAGRANEPVPDRSVFKTAFLDLIEGRATEPFRDGYITGAELGLYLKNQVPIYNEAQHPQYGKIRDPKLDKGDFVFVLQRRNTSSPQADLPPLATLSVTSTPSGATVYLDGAVIGKTPLRSHEIDTGVRREKQVEIGLELTGYKSRVKNVTLISGENVPWDVILEPVLAPKPEKKEILAAAVEAHGGIEKLQAVKNFVMKRQTAANTPNGPMQIEEILSYLYPDKVRQDMNIPEIGEMSQIFDGESAFMKGQMGVQPLPPEVVNIYRDSVFRETIWLLTNLTLNDIPMQYAGTEEVNGTPASVILVTQPSGEMLRIFISEETHYVVKMSFRETSQGVTANWETLFDDFRDVDGIHISHHIVQNVDGELFSETWVNDVMLNADVDASLFEE